jgi:hypothetical protein
MLRAVLTVAIVVLAWPAAAQQLTLKLHDGRVTLDANAVPVRQILAEWARVGGTKVVGADKITGAPVTLHIVNMPERQALDIVLRNVAGFMAAPRLASAAPGESTYDRILILATTSAPAPAPAAANNGRPNTTNVAGRRLPPRPPNLPPSPAENDTPAEETQTVNEDQADTGVNQQPVFTFPAPPAPGGAAGGPVFQPVQMGPPFARPGQPGVATPVITLQPNANGQPAIYNFVPGDPNAQPAVAQPVVPGSPFNVIGSPAPGMIQQPVPQPVPGQRPPGQQQ